MNKKQEYVVYVVAVTSMRVKAVDNPTAAIDASDRVKALLKGEDRNVYIPKVAVVNADDDEIQKENIAKGEAPWLTDAKFFNESRVEPDIPKIGGPLHPHLRQARDEE